MFIQKELQYLEFSHENTYCKTAWDYSAKKFVIRIEQEEKSTGQRSLLFSNSETGLSPSLGDVRLICQHYGFTVPSAVEEQLVSQWRNDSFPVSDQLPERFMRTASNASRTWVEARHIRELADLLHSISKDK